MAAMGTFAGGRRRLVPLVVGSVLTLVAVVGLVFRQVALGPRLLIAVTAFAPYLMAAVVPALLVLLLWRHWIAAAAAAAVLALCVFTQAPLFVGQDAPADGRRLVVMTANLRLGLADPPALVDRVREHHVDVLMTQELTAAEARRLASAGLSTLLPHTELEPRDGAAGVGVWSRYPLTVPQAPRGYLFGIVSARLEMPGVAVEPTVLTTHMPGPWPQDPAAWHHDIDRLPATLRDLASHAPDGAVIVGGDFNATFDTAQFRRLLIDGYRDAAEQSGSGYTPTYPGDTWTGPLIAIDHVLTRNAVAASARTLSVAGSDHRALLTTIVVPA